MTKTIAFETYQTQSNGYDHTHVVIREMYVEDVAEHLAGTVGNKAGYGTLAACARERVRFQALLNAGYNTFFETGTSGLNVHIRWQHYYGGGELGYCEPTYEDLGRTFGQIEQGMAFLRKIGRKVEAIQAAQRAQKYGCCASDVSRVSNHTFATPTDLLVVLTGSPLLRKGRAIRVRRDKTLQAYVPTDVRDIRVPTEGAVIVEGVAWP